MERMRAGGDMHSEMALRAWPGELRGLSPAEVRKHPRRDHAKAVGYGLFYGKTAQGMGISIRGDDGEPIGTAKAQAILDAYHAAVPALAKLQRYFIEYGLEHWGIHTLLGRFRPVADIHSEDEYRRGDAERQLLNTPIQGSAHDVVATAMLRTNTVPLPALLAGGWFNEALAATGAQGVLQVHDELQWRVPTASAESAAVLVKAVMENPFPPGVFSVPLRADVHVADNWSAAK
jgi:DNA polymerase-1